MELGIKFKKFTILFTRMFFSCKITICLAFRSLFTCMKVLLIPEINLNKVKMSFFIIRLSVSIMKILYMQNCGDS